MSSLKALKTLCGISAAVMVLSGCGGGAGSSLPAASGFPSATASSATATQTSSGGGSSESGPSTAATGTATLTWTAPIANSDGTALTNLAGYHIYYGTTPGSLSKEIDISSPSTVSYVVTSLSAGTWYFTIAAYTNSGIESQLSNVASKTIS